MESRKRGEGKCSQCLHKKVVSDRSKYRKGQDRAGKEERRDIGKRYWTDAKMKARYRRRRRRSRRRTSDHKGTDKNDRKTTRNSYRYGLESHVGPTLA